MSFKPFFATLFLFWITVSSQAADFFTTSGFKFVRHEGELSFSANVDFPVEGKAVAVKSVKAWICEMLEVDAPAHIDEANFEQLLQKSFEGYKQEAERGSRRIDIYRSYEDGQVVTYQAEVTDKDSTTWRSDDCASFSKADGHRIQAKEIFNCSESKVKELMWRFRGDLKMGVSKPKDLIVGNAGYIDGWIVVIGPAEGYTGAAYRIRYQVAEPYLKGKRSGEYYQGNDD
jgi:hypothetical protein